MEDLLAHHRQHLHASGLTDETLSAARISSCTDPREAAELLNWTGGDGPVPSIAFPIFSPDGQQSGVVLRPDVPHLRQDGSAPKYEARRGESPRPYFPPPSLVASSLYLDATAPLLLTEGIKKALVIAQATAIGVRLAPIALHGVDLFHDVAHRRATGLLRPHADLRPLLLPDRVVYIALDGGDTSENIRVIRAEARMARMLLDLGADVRLVRIPFTPGGPKVGADDFLAGQQDQEAGLQELLAESLLADPLARAHDVRIIIGVRRGTEVRRLLHDRSFAASLVEGGSVIIDLTAEELREAGVRATSVREAVEQFEEALARPTGEGEPADGSGQAPFTPEIEEAAEALLTDPQMLERFLRGLEAEGVVGESDSAVALLLVMVSRKTKRPVHAAVKAASSSGKNFVAYRVASRFPPSEVVLLTDLSPRSLLFQKGSMKGKVFIIAEQEGAERAEYTMRVAMSEGSLSVLVAEKSGESGGGAIESRQHSVEGPACFITTTTRAALHDENETRVLEIVLDESEDQTRRIIRAQARRAANPPTNDELERQEQERLVWQCALAGLEYTETVNPSAQDLLEQFPTRHIRARRDFQRVLDLAAACAILHQRQRQVVNERVVVDHADVRVARELCDALYSTTSPRMQSLADRLREQFGSVEFTTAEAAQRLGYSTDAFRRNLGDMEAQDLIRKVQDSRGSRAARWQMGGTTAPEPGRPPQGQPTSTSPVSAGRPPMADIPVGSRNSVGTAGDSSSSDRPTLGVGEPQVRAPVALSGRASEAAVPLPSRPVGQPDIPIDSTEFRPTDTDVGQGRPTVLPSQGPTVFRDQDLAGEPS